MLRGLSSGVDTHGRVSGRADTKRQAILARPDTASINAGIVSNGADAKSTLAANSKAMGDIFKSLKDMGIADRDIQTRNFSIAPRYARRQIRQQPGQPVRQQNVVIGYRVTNTVAVRVRDLARLGGLIDRLTGAGANQMNGIRFFVDKTENLMDEARRWAIADARRKAELLATEAGARLMRVLTIAEGGARPGPRKVLRAMALQDSAASVPVAAGEQTIRANVSVTYDLE